jgi:phenylalanyl-tRNA synthetase beta chain
LVIAGAAKPLGLAGVKGGAETEVDESTKTIVLECGTFDMTAVRHTARTYGVFSEAATRFTKSQSPLQNLAVLAKTVEAIKGIAGGRVASKLYDEKVAGLTEAKPVSVRQPFINSRLGLELSITEMKKLLENVEFTVTAKGEELLVKPPFWRTDIEIAEDVIEEVGRLYGYDRLPLKLPQHDLTPAEQNPLISFKNNLRQVLSRAGANEVLTYSFVHGSLLEKVGQDTAKSYKLRNALSPDLQYYRQSLTPSLLEKVQPNIKAGFDKFSLFEIGKGHVKGILDEDKLPKEFEQLSLIVASKHKLPGASYFEAKKMAEYLLEEVGAKQVSYEPPTTGQKTDFLSYYEPSRSADLVIDGQIIGRLGEFKAAVASSLKLPGYCAGFEIDITKLLQMASSSKYQSLNRYPEIEQDFCLRSRAEITYVELTAFMDSQLSQIAKQQGYNYSLTPLDIYQRPEDKTHKQTTWHISLSHPQRTLTTDEANKTLDRIAEAAKKQLNAERI